jgi:ADP-ribose pyrophosphatase YjhB (NUDIX family)
MSKRRLAVSAIVFDSQRRILLVRQGLKRHDWELPGGKVKKRESPTEALVREVREETGLAVMPERLIGIFFIRQELFYDFVIACRLVEPQQKPTPRPPEIVECGFFATDRLPQPIRPFTVQRIQDVVDGVTHPLPVELTPEQWVG